MPDLLVNLNNLPHDTEEEKRIASEEGIKVFPAVVPDKEAVVNWVKQHSTVYAAAECEVCFANKPVSCLIAAKGKEIIGYACYNATALDFFGPTKVLEEYQGKGIGKLLLIRSLYAMKELGYAYAIIGGAGPVGFYEKTVSAVVIESSEHHNIYEHFLKIE